MSVYLHKIGILALKFQHDAITSFPAFGAPITSGDLNLLIGDLSFSVRRQEATPVFLFFLF